MQHLEKLLIPTCKRIPNRALCDVLRQNADLLWLDISNKLNPKVDARVVETIAWSCQYLRVLKLSDYHMEDPRSLLVICGRIAVGSNNSLERRKGYETSIEDHSSQFGCLELETLWLDNVNLNDQVAAILMQNLPCLRDLNMSDTDICNPWRLLDPLQATHLKYMCYLDVKSTALSKKALEMIPKFHPELQKFSASSTTLPPHVYSNIGQLTGVTELELIGSQFYPCAPEEIFQQGISPAVCGIGKNLSSLNLTYFAHVEFQAIALNCPKIEYLDLSHTTISFTFPCASLGQCCPCLTSLNLAFCHIDPKEEKIGEKQEEEEQVELSEEKALEIMIGHPPNLEKLHLGGLAVADDTVKTIFPEQSVNPLRTLNISRCRLITISGVQHIWDWCPFIHSVDMTHCREITVTEYHTFEKRCFRDRPRFKMEGKIDWS